MTTNHRQAHPPATSKATISNASLLEDSSYEEENDMTTGVSQPEPPPPYHRIHIKLPTFIPSPNYVVPLPPKRTPIIPQTSHNDNDDNDDNDDNISSEDIDTPINLHPPYHRREEVLELMFDFVQHANMKDEHMTRCKVAMYEAIKCIRQGAKIKKELDKIFSSVGDDSIDDATMFAVFCNSANHSKKGDLIVIRNICAMMEHVEI